MLDQIRKKRLNLTQEIDSNRPRVSSSEKRRLIEANLRKFKNDVKQSQMRSAMNSAQNFYPNMNQSPTMKDLINPFLRKQKDEQKFTHSESQSPRFQQQQLLKKSREAQEKNQAFDNFQIKKDEDKNIQKQSNQLKQSSKIGQKVVNLSLNNQFSLERKISFGEESHNLQNVINSINTPTNSQSPLQATYKNQENSGQLNFNYNNSNYGSSNGSSAIFFTSQFRDFINRQKSDQDTKPITQVNNNEQQKQKKENEDEDRRSYSNSRVKTQTDKQIGQSFLRIGQQDLSQSNEGNQSRTKKLLHNQSGRSLAFSNQQSLIRENKESNELTNFQQIVNKKIGQQLILSMEDFGRNSLKQLAQRYMEHSLGEACRLISEEAQLSVRIKKFIEQKKRRMVRYCFDGFLILREYKFEQVKNEIKVENFRKERQIIFQKLVFNQWKDCVLQQEIKILQMKNKKSGKMQKNIFQVFKMVWFDSKVKKQVDMYYLSKIFIGWKNVFISQNKKSESRALKQYCRSLKKFFFQKICEGTYSMRTQKMHQQLAYNHYQEKMRRKFFQAWLQQCERSPQFVSLTMTSKSVFKQTLDSKWTGMKTVDFKQLKF